MESNNETAGLSRESVDALLQSWAARTVDEEELSPPMPLDVLQGEVRDLSELVDFHFQPRTVHQQVLPGLVSVAHRGEVTESTAAELRELNMAVGAAQARQRILLQQIDNTPIDRAEEILAEFRAGLSYVLEDGQHPQGEAQLERLRTDFRNESSHDGLAAALEGYSELAAQVRSEMEALGDFDTALLDEALNVASALRKRSAERLTGELADEQRAMLRLRNRLVGALLRRVQAARRAFRWVFRAHPEIAQKASSEYSRTQRRNHRRTQRTSPTTQTTNAPTDVAPAAAETTQVPQAEG